VVDALDEAQFSEVTPILSLLNDIATLSNESHGQGEIGTQKMAN
jgi:hypothetical protein